MPTYLKDLKDVLQRQMPLWATSHVVPRGLLIPLDPFLTGTARAAKKVGDTLPVLVPNNTATLASELHTEDTILVLNDNTLTYIEPGFLMSLGGQKIVGVINKDGNTISLSEKASVSMQPGETVSVFAFPVKVLGTRLVPQPPLPRPNIIEFKSAVQVMQGDHLDISDENTGSYNEYEIVEVLASRRSPDSIDAENPYIYEVKIAQVLPASIPENVADNVTTLEGIPRDLWDGETIYLRAFPAYFSKPLIVDSTYFNVPTAEIGPYILDRVSGLVIDNPESEPPTDENPAGEGQVDVDEVIEIKLFHSNLTLFSTSQLGVREQLPVWNSVIESEHMIMWSPIRGTLDFEDGFMVINLDSYGHAEVETFLVPEINVKMENLPVYSLISQSDQQYKICLDFYPNQYVTNSATMSAPGKYADTLTLNLNPDAVNPRAIKITASGVPHQKVKIHSISSSLPRITNIKYNILAKTVGQYHWASSGLLQKPMWMSAYLTEAIGVQVPIDGGKIMYQGRRTRAQENPPTSKEC